MYASADYLKVTAQLLSPTTTMPSTLTQPDERQTLAAVPSESSGSPTVVKTRPNTPELVRPREESPEEVAALLSSLNIKVRDFAYPQSQPSNLPILPLAAGGSLVGPRPLKRQRTESTMESSEDVDQKTSHESHGESRALKRTRTYRALDEHL